MYRDGTASCLNPPPHLASFPSLLSVSRACSLARSFARARTLRPSSSDVDSPRDEERRFFSVTLSSSAANVLRSFFLYHHVSLGLSLLSFIKPPYRLALSFFALGACRLGRRCSASSRQSNRITPFHLGRFIFRCLLNSAFFQCCAMYTIAATLIGRLVDFSFDLSVSFSLGISRLSTSRQQFHNHHGGEISGFRSSFPSFLLPFTRYNFASVVARGAARRGGDSRSRRMAVLAVCSVVLHPPSSMSFCFFIHRCSPLFLPLTFRFTSAVRASAST